MSKCWYCNEELTSATYCDEHVGICTKCYNSMFKVSNDFVKGLTDKIADLEAKLAEKEKEYDLKYKHWIEEIRENDRLREELAKTNKEWVQSIHDWKELCKKKDQDKISFAVNNIDNIRNNIGNYFMTNKLIWTDKIMVGKICNVINEAFDNQIEELKKGENNG